MRASPKRKPKPARSVALQQEIDAARAQRNALEDRHTPPVGKLRRDFLGPVKTHAVRLEKALDRLGRFDMDTLELITWNVPPGAIKELLAGIEHADGILANRGRGRPADDALDDLVADLVKALVAAGEKLTLAAFKAELQRGGYHFGERRYKALLAYARLLYEATSTKLS
jgi:hypothetical protein